MQERAGRKFVVSASKVDIEASTDDDSVRTAINKAMKIAEVRGKRACRSIARPSTAVRKLTLPKMAQEELAGAVRWEGGMVIPYDM